MDLVKVLSLGVRICKMGINKSPVNVKIKRKKRCFIQRAKQSQNC